jgi:hypothetical protein
MAATRAAVATGWLMLALASAAWAGPVTLQAQSLLATPGTITVDRENVTAVQFCDTIGWLAYKAPWLHAQVSQQDRRVLLLDASAASGEASMAVWVDGESTPLQLLVRASGTTLANHLYFVSCAGQPQKPAAQSNGPQPAGSRPASVGGGTAAGGAVASRTPASSPTSSGAPETTWDSFVSGLSPRQWDLLKALIASPTADTDAAFTASLSPAQAAAWATLAPAAHLAPPAGAAAEPGTSGQAPAPAMEQPAPSWLVWQARAARGNGDLIVAYTVTNTGNAEVVLDGVRLQVLDAAGKPLPGVSVSRQDTSGFEGRVAPGGLESGVIRVPAASSDEVTVRWPVVEIGAGTTYVLNAHLQATR